MEEYASNELVRWWPGHKMSWKIIRALSDRAGATYGFAKLSFQIRLLDFSDVKSCLLAARKEKQFWAQKGRPSNLPRLLLQGEVERSDLIWSVWVRAVALFSRSTLLQTWLLITKGYVPHPATLAAAGGRALGLEIKGPLSTDVFSSLGSSPMGSLAGKHHNGFKCCFYSTAKYQQIWKMIQNFVLIQKNILKHRTKWT